jgi:hypothetical protein
MVEYGDGSKNYDRLISYCALVAFAKIQQANLGYARKVEREDKNLENPNKMRNFLLGGSDQNIRPNNPFAKPKAFRYKNLK